MKKLALDIETLEVTSFATGAGAQAARGTVQGHARTMACTGITLCDTFCNASLQYTDCIATSQ